MQYYAHTRQTEVGEIVYQTVAEHLTETAALCREFAEAFGAGINMNIKTKESQIFFAGEEITWNKYMEELKKWAKLSHQMAEFILNVFKEINKDKSNAGFPYCKVEGHCVLVQHNLIYPEVDGEYTSFFKTGFNMDLLDYVNEEQKYIKEVELNEQK